MIIAPFREEIFGVTYIVISGRGGCLYNINLTKPLNAKGVMDDINEDLKAFLDYVAGRKSDNEYEKTRRSSKGRKQERIENGGMNT